MMRVGVYVSREMVGLVLVRGANILWHRSLPVVDRSPSDVLMELLHEAPISRWPRPDVAVAIDGPDAIVKVVRGLPEAADARTLTRIVATMPHRYFLAEPGSLVTTDVERLEPGVVRVGAIRTTCLRDIETAVRACALRVDRYIPVAVLGDITVPEALSPELAPAYAAASRVHSRLGRWPGQSASSLTYRPPRVREPGYWRRHAWLVGGLLGVIAIGAIVVLPLQAIRAERLARTTIATLASSRARAQVTQRELEHVRLTIGAVSQFTESRISHTWLVSQLTDALPIGSAITTLRTDSAGVLLILLAPRAADVVRQLEGIPGVERVAIVGPVTHETVNAMELERVSVRFGYRDLAPHIRQPVDSIQARRKS